MNTFKGTPEPFLRDGRTVYALYSPNGKQERNRFYAGVTPDYAQGTAVIEEEMVANAKLFVASKQMMEALQNLIDHSEKEDLCDGVEKFVYTPTRSPYLSQLIKNAKAALSAALD